MEVKKLMPRTRRIKVAEVKARQEPYEIGEVHKDLDDDGAIKKDGT